MPSATSAVSGLLAAIDMGSNSFRVEIAHLHQGRYKRVSYLKETVRLGAGLDANGYLTEDASQRGLDCLARFAERLRGLAPSRVRAVATQTLREARNRDAFLAQAQPQLGYPIEVISGREEARLIFTGVARLQPSQLPRLVIDIGGRSTEMIIGRGRQAQHAESFRVGSVSLSMKYFGNGRFTKQAFREAQIAAGAELEEALEPFAPSHWVEALGSSGTVGAVSQVLAANRITSGAVTPHALRWLMEQCLRAGSIDKLDLPGLKDDRRAVIGGGLSILYTLATHFGIDKLEPARGALRQGVIFDLDDRLHAAEDTEDHDALDARSESVRLLQQRFAVDKAQAARVQTIAFALYGDVQPDATLDLRRELQWICALHEIGMALSHHDHHRHSAYIVSHVDAAGFSQSQLRRLGEMLLAQRGSLAKVESTLELEGVAWQVLCLRLAIIVCHARGDVDPALPTLHRGGTHAMLQIPPDWPESRPRTLHLLREECEAWSRAGPLTLSLG